MQSRKPARGHNQMFCQLCTIKKATRRVTARSPSGQLEEAHYCADCYDAKYVKPQPDKGALPRPRFTIKAMIILVCVCGVFNAVTAWIMRSGYFTRDPDQLRQWTTYVFVAVNLFLGLYVFLLSLGMWFVRFVWFKRTGGLVPMPQQQPVKQQLAVLVRMWPLFAWFVVTGPLAVYVIRRIWPDPRYVAQLFVLIVLCPPLLFMAFAFPKNRFLRNRIQQEWRTASRQERVLKGALIAWTFGFVAVFAVGGPQLMLWGLTNRFPVPPVLLAWFVVEIVLMALAAASIRRR